MAGKSKIPPKIAHGLLLIDKPKGHSSFDVIRDLRRITGVKKMGHTGTLDPMATGLLVICLGEGTKLVPYLTADDKSYEAEITFGLSTDSYDAEGKIVARDTWTSLKSLTKDKIQEVMLSFLGTQAQKPPAFSAIKVNGERLYEKARRGEEVEVPTRTVTFHEIDMLSYNGGNETDDLLPKLRIKVKCSKGTYIRSLAFDLGQKLGVNTHLSALRRTQAGAFTLSAAHNLKQINGDFLHDLLTPLAEALPQATHLSLNDEAVLAVKQGKMIPAPEGLTNAELSLCRATDLQGRLIALLTFEKNKLKVLRGFNP